MKIEKNKDLTPAEKLERIRKLMNMDDEGAVISQKNGTRE